MDDTVRCAQGRSLQHAQDRPLRQAQGRSWIIRETAWEPERLHHRETVFTIGNGYLGTRGAFEEGYPGAWQATFIHGVYDDVPIAWTELANIPDWLPFSLLVEGECFRLDRGQLLDYRRELDLRNGLLTRTVRWRSPKGRTVDVRIQRFASLADPHVCAIRYQVTPLDFGGRLEFRAGLDGHVDNPAGLTSGRSPGYNHWDAVDQGMAGDMVWLHVRARASGTELAQAARLMLRGAEDVEQSVLDCPLQPTLVARCRVGPGQTVTADKGVVTYTSREVVDVCHAAQERLARLDEGYEALLAAHEAEWARYWAASDVVVEGDEEAQRALRFSVFQLLIAAPRHDDRVSIPAKGLSGFAYRGHIFWDCDIFMLPFFTYTQPQLARNLLLYRYHTLPGARRKAAGGGFEGAQYPWESAGTGDEVTPTWVPRHVERRWVRIWTGDQQLHICSDVAYAVWSYWQVTGDDDFLANYGAEIILDTAVFWGSRAGWNAGQERYEIRGVMGPDEYHHSVNDNAFTNGMVRWHLETALKVLDWLRQHHPDKGVELTGRLGLTEQRLAHWRDIVRRLHFPHDPITGLIEQFDGYFERLDVDPSASSGQALAAYEPRTRSMQVILGIEGANESQVLKQPDVLTLLWLLRDHYDEKTLRANWKYYVPRTDHAYGSSLGPAVHAILACELGEPDAAYEHFMQAARADLEDIRGNAGEGVHAGSAGGLWQAAVFGFGGLRVTPTGWTATPRLPAHWKRLVFRFRYRGELVEVNLK